jgi:hypothetical protein
VLRAIQAWQKIAVIHSALPYAYKSGGARHIGQYHHGIAFNQLVDNNAIVATSATI